MIIRHNSQVVSDYYERIGMNQSSLKVILTDGMQSYLVQRDALMKTNERYYEEKEHFVIGNAVDIYLTQGQEIFEATHYNSTMIKKPSDAVLSIVMEIFQSSLEQFKMRTAGSTATFNFELDEEEMEPYIQQSIINHQYYNNWGMAAKQKKIIEEGKLYFQELVAAQGKQVLSTEEGMRINAIVISILTHPHTKDLFHDGEDIDIIFQLPMYFEYEGIDCKALMDMLIINHTRQRLMPIDIKTLGFYSLTFNKTIRKRRYDIQGAFYMQGLISSKSLIANLIEKDISGYAISSFAFIAESSIQPGNPIVAVLTKDLIIQGQIGSNTDEKILGFYQAIEKYKLWMNNDFSIPKILSESNGVLFVDSDYQYTNSIL